VIDGKGVSRSFGSISAVAGIDFQVQAGSVLGLIGPNGAGKTTLLRALLGLTTYDGDIDILGYSPRRQRATLMEQVCFIADTAVLPGWMLVKQLLDYVAGIHPRFDRAHAEQLLLGTEVGLSRVQRAHHGACLVGQAAVRHRSRCVSCGAHGRGLHFDCHRL